MSESEINVAIRAAIESDPLYVLGGKPSPRRMFEAGMAFARPVQVERPDEGLAALIESALTEPAQYCERVHEYSAFHDTEPMLAWQTRAVLLALAAAPVPVERPDERIVWLCECGVWGTGEHRCGTCGSESLRPAAARLPEQPDEGPKGGIVNGEWLSETTLRALYRYLDNGPRLGEVTRALRSLAARPTVPEENPDAA